MSQEDPRLSHIEIRAVGTARSRDGIVLAVGEFDLWKALGHATVTEGGVHFAGIAEVDEDLLSRVNPNLVISPILTSRFDCIDLAMRLHALGYRGKYRAIAAFVPDPAIIEREIYGFCPGLDFKVLITPA